ncbi:MAG TPA: hypothetical protein VMB50_00760 [Myxococcales bacterium]|nr:hypothetical protein [Myxococcales bacterium]
MSICTGSSIAGDSRATGRARSSLTRGVGSCGQCGEAAPGCAGCGLHTDGAGASECLPPASKVSYQTLVGGSDGVSPGTLAGYALVATDLMTYRFRWTGDNAVTGVGYREFYGSVWTSGHFTSQTIGCVNDVCPLEAGDFVSAPYDVPGGQRIDWDTFASDGWDGFAFTTDTEPLYFDVHVDGSPRPDLVLFPSAPNGGTPLSPAATPFGMSSTS